MSRCGTEAAVGRNGANSIGLLEREGIVLVPQGAIAVTNLLHLPGLDGGHLLLLAIESFRGRPLTQRVAIAVNGAGLAIVAGLMLVACWNDISRLLANAAR